MQPGTSTVLEPQHVRARQAKASHSISFVVRPRWAVGRARGASYLSPPRRPARGPGRDRIARDRQQCGVCLWCRRGDRLMRCRRAASDWVLELAVVVARLALKPAAANVVKPARDAGRRAGLGGPGFHRPLVAASGDLHLAGLR